MPQTFQDRKAKILADLATPDEDYQDLSPKGSVDAGIRDLISEINASPDYVTTSSCAGRIAVYLEGSKGAKGGGKWLFTSHDPVDLPKDDGKVLEMFGLQQCQAGTPPDAGTARFVHIKYEPMILHILTASLPAAQRACSAALSAGFRESGINGILDTGGLGPQAIAATPIVAVRTAGLAFDCIIGHSHGEGDVVKPMVTEDYLRTLVEIANGRFKTNDERRERFRKTLLKQ